ncbi:MAG: tetratricopeptide repeat protein, partial [Pirellulaceae bacterium]|nr:tetratricopeptide repeat protein [Pirellulaceae bacterium]
QRIDILRGACQGDKTHPIFWSRLAAELLDDARDHAEAYQQLKRALRYNPSDGRALSLFGDYYWGRQQREEALELYRLAASLNDKDESQSRRYFMAARYFQLTNDALVWLRDRYRRFGDRNSSPGRTLAGALELVDQTPESLQIIEQTAARHPNDGELLSYAALTFGRYNQPERAKEYLQAAHGKCSESMFARASASLTLYQGNLPEARQLFLDVIRCDPLDLDARERVLQLDLDLDGPDLAEQRLRAAVTEYPHSYSLRVMLIQFLRNYKLAEVGSELDRFLEFHPRDAWARREAAIVAIAAHDLPRAADELTLALELEPHNELSHFLSGKVLERQGDIPGARTAYRRALELNIDCDSAIGSLVETCDRPAERSEQLEFILQQLRLQTTYGDGVMSYRDAANGRIEPAKLLEQLEEARAHRPDLWQVWSVVVQQHLAMNQRSQAIDVARQATERFPLVPRSWLDLALAYRHAGDHPAELQALERARAINPHWTEVARELCELYMTDAQFDLAEEVIRQVLVSDPRDPVSKATLAECLYRAGKKQAALEPLSEACASTTGDDWAWSKLCEWSRELDEGKSARQAAQQAIEARPHDARSYRRMAEALQEIDEIPQALEHIETSLQLDDRSIDTHVLKAYYLGKLHLWDEALAACSPPVFAGDEPVLLRIRRAYVLYRKGQVTPAIDEMRSALERDPDHYGAWNQLADWADEHQRPEVYKQAAENMVRLDPHQPAPRGYLADALLAEENGRAAAKHHLRAALEFSPDYAYGAMRLFDLHLDDKELDAAQDVLELGATHLPPGFESSLRAQLLAARDALQQPVGREAIDFILNWCQEDIPDRVPLLRALKQLELPAAQLLISQLTDRILQGPAASLKPAVGIALGNLIVRVQNAASIMATLKKIPDGDSWHETTRSMLRGLIQFQKEASLVDMVRQKFTTRIKLRTETWAAMASIMFDYGRNSEVVKWTSDWRRRTDVTAKNMLVVVASRWELFQLGAARQATLHALSLEEDESTPLLHVWAGLDALLRGNHVQALEHARTVSAHQMVGWYQVGYLILVNALDALPGLLLSVSPGALSDQAGPSKQEARQLVAAFKPGVFPLDAPFANDQMTKWLLRQVAARVAQAHGLTVASWINRLTAFSYTWK